MKFITNRQCVRNWALIIASCAAIGWLGVPQTHAAKILFIVSAVDADGTANLANDEEVVTRLTSRGHTVTIADDQDASLDTFLVGQDLILISSSTGSGNQPLNMLSLDPLKTGTTPVICYEPGLWDELGFQIVTTNPGYGNAGGHTSLAMNSANQSHPLAAGKSGTISMVTSGTATFSSSDLPVQVGDDAIIIASTAANAPSVDLGRLAIWAYDLGDRLVDNTTSVPSRRVAFFFNASTAVNIYNTNAYDLLYAAVNWALAIGATNDPPRIKNLLPANDAAFVSATQGISFAVTTFNPNTIPTANIHLILNGTDRTSSLVIGGTANNRTVNLPGPLIANTFYNGQIMVTDNANRSTTVNWSFDTFPAVRPRPNASGVNPATDVFAELVDDGYQVNASSIVLTFNGSPVSVTPSKVGARTSFSYDPPGLLASGSTNVVTLVFSDTQGKSYTNSWRFSVLNYAVFPTLPPSFKAPPGAVDLNRPGSLLKLRQMEVARPGGGNVASVRQQLDDLYIDPNTSQPYADLIDRSQPGFNQDGTYTETGFINYNQDANGVAAEAGVFTANNGFADLPIPGIPGTTLSTDNMAMQALTYLDLKAGVYRFGVNSDDGFRVTGGPAPQDVFSLVLGEVNADRGQATTTFDFVVQEDGFYPIELLYWETGGGAEVEFFSIDPITGANILINNRTNSASIKAYRPASIAVARPYVRSINPVQGATGVIKASTINAVIVDGTATLNTNSIQLQFNGGAVSPSITKTGAVTSVSYDPPGDLPVLSSNFVTLVFTDNGTPAVSRTNSWSFIVESSAPKALQLTGAPTASDNLVRSRLQSLGFEVISVLDTASQTSDANGKAIIVISSTVGSGNIATKYTAVPVPIINWESALYDDLGMEANDAAGATIPTQTDLEIVDATHPLAAGLSAGVKTVLTVAGDITTLTDVVPSAKVVARATDGTSRPVIFGIEKGDALNPTRVATAPARRVGFFLANDTFINATTNGLMLFDAAVKWAANLSTAVPKFNPPVLAGSTITVSWTGGGTLQEASDASGPYTNVAGNPQGTYSTSATGARKFYRVAGP